MNTLLEQEHEKFLQACHTMGDEVFRSVYNQTKNKDISTYLTRKIFNSTWKDLMSCYNSPTTKWGMKRLIMRQSKVELANYTEAKIDRMNYYSKLWNLTLTQ